MDWLLAWIIFGGRRTEVITNEEAERRRVAHEEAISRLALSIHRAWRDPLIRISVTVILGYAILANTGNFLQVMGVADAPELSEPGLFPGVLRFLLGASG